MRRDEKQNSETRVTFFASRMSNFALPITRFDCPSENETDPARFGNRVAKWSFTGQDGLLAFHQTSDSDTTPP